MLRNHLDNGQLVPEQCTFRVVAHGPILPEADDWPIHVQRRDQLGAIEKRLADDLAQANYEVMNTVNCLNLSTRSSTRRRGTR